MLRNVHWRVLFTSFTGMSMLCYHKAKRQYALMRVNKYNPVNAPTYDCPQFARLDT